MQATRNHTSGNMNKSVIFVRPHHGRGHVGLLRLPKLQAIHVHNKSTMQLELKCYMVLPKIEVLDWVVLQPTNYSKIPRGFVISKAQVECYPIPFISVSFHPLCPVTVPSF